MITAAPPATVAPRSPAPAAPPGSTRWRLSVLDLLPVTSAVLWVVSVARVNLATLGDYGLVRLLPVTYFVALALLVVSFIAVLAAPRPSVPRLALHIVLLVVFLHATVALLFAEPRYSWVYKHFGVVNSFNAHGALRPSVDIYQNWPGFFAVAAFFTRLAGVAGPIRYAAWAQLYFNLLDLLAFGFFVGALTKSWRKRWLAIFLFECANWVGQDYFAPQAFGYLLCLIIFGIVLRWCATGGTARWVGWLERVARQVVWLGHAGPAPHGARGAPAPWRRGAVAAVLLLTFVTVMSHQLSPYMAVLGVAILTVTGVIRPKWLAPVMLLIALAYLAPNFSYINKSFGVIKQIGHPFQNSQPKRPLGAGLPGRQFAADGARLLSLAMWGLAGVGTLRRLRAGLPVVHLVLAALSPVGIIFAGGYQGEAVYRVFLFALPWVAFLAAEAVGPTDAAGLRALGVPAVALLCILACFVPAYYGLDEVNQILPAEVAASTYFYAHAAPGGVLVLADTNFPSRVAGNYDEHAIGTGDPLLLEDPGLRGKVPTAAELPYIDGLVAASQPSPRTPGYLAISRSMRVTWDEFGLTPPHALDDLERVLLNAPRWSVFYRDADTVIFELAPAAPAARG